MKTQEQLKKEIEELINRTLDTIQAKWDKKSEEAEEEGEGTVDFDILLDIVKEALIFIYEQGAQSKEKEMLDEFNKMIDKIDDERTTQISKYISILQNQNCFTPKIKTEVIACLVNQMQFKDRIKEELSKLEGLK